jgi:hypothetical protein
VVRVKPTQAEVAIADAVAERTGRPTEHVAKAVAWGADEHVLCALALGWWLYARTRDVSVRRGSDHVLLTTLVASALPHLLETIFDQERTGPLSDTSVGSRCPESGSTLFRLDMPSTSAPWHRRRRCCRPDSEMPSGRWVAV